VGSSTALLTALQEFGESIDQSHASLSAPLRDLTRDLKSAVDAFVDVEVTIFADLGLPITLTDFTDGADPAVIRGSFRLVLAALQAADSIGHVTFYASRPGAVVDLAADLTYVLARAAIETSTSALSLHVDEQLQPTNRQADLTGIEEASIVGRAVGVLVGRGLPPQHAGAALVLGAQRARAGVVAYARRILAGPRKAFDAGQGRKRR
jgi:hypothetical protein